MKPFEFFKVLTETKENLDLNGTDLGRKYSPYIIDNIVSMVQLFTPFANAINGYPNLPKQAHFEIYHSALPKRKQYVNYIRKYKDDDAYKKEFIMKYFEIGKKDCERYLQFLTEEQVNEIVKKFQHGIIR